MEEKNNELMKIGENLAKLSLNNRTICGSDAALSVCFICRGNIQEQCDECNNRVAAIRECPRVSGVCKHVYHLHCIEGWLKDRKIFLIDLSNWKYAN